MMRDDTSHGFFFPVARDNMLRTNEYCACAARGAWSAPRTAARQSPSSTHRPCVRALRRADSRGRISSKAARDRGSWVFIFVIEKAGFLELELEGRTRARRETWRKAHRRCH